MVGFGTLLGPEESGPQTPLGGFSWGWGLFVLCLLRCLLAVCWWVGLVGGVFDMWIVDASIWRQPVRLVGVFFLVGWWVVVFCFVVALLLV